MKIKSILLLGTLVLPLIPYQISFASETESNKRENSKVSELSQYYNDYAKALGANIEKDFLDYFFPSYSSNSSGIEPYKNKAADIDTWKQLILSYQYVIRDANHRAFIKEIIAKKELSKDEVLLLFYAQHYIRSNIIQTTRKLSNLPQSGVNYNTFQNALAASAFPEIFSEDQKIKEKQNGDSFKLDTPVEILNFAGIPHKYDVHVESVKSSEVKDFSLSKELQKQLSTLSEDEKKHLQKRGGLITQISEMVRLVVNSDGTSRLADEGYLMFSFVLDDKLEIKNVYLIRLIKPEETNTNSQKDSEFFSANELSRKIQSLTTESRLPTPPQKDKENLRPSQYEQGSPNSYSWAQETDRGPASEMLSRADFLKPGYSPDQQERLREAYENPEYRRHLKGSSNRYQTNDKRFLPPITQ